MAAGPHGRHQTSRGLRPGPRLALLFGRLRLGRRRSAEFLAAAWTRAWRDEVPTRAASLTFTTLLALVPIGVLAFGVLSSFPGFHEQLNALSASIIRHLIPVSRETVLKYLTEFGVHAARLSAWGLLWVVGLVTLILWEIDSALNRIWRSRHRRSILATLVGYWALATLGPVLLSIGFTTTSFLFTKYQALVSFSQWLGWIGLWILPLSVETVGFALLFLLAPRAYVRVRHALAGGLFTTTLFEISKRVFAVYVAQVHNYERVYGALAVIPLFMVWVYIVWVIVLLGAEVTYCLGARCHRSGISDEQAGRSVRLAFRLLGHLWTAHALGRGLRMERLQALERDYSAAAIQEMLGRLEAMRLVAPVAGGNSWLLGRDLDRYTLHDLYRGARLSLRADWPAGEEADRWDRALAAVLGGADAALAERLAVPIASLLEERGPAPRDAGPKPGGRTRAVRTGSDSTDAH